jgi:hypothetical protein
MTYIRIKKKKKKAFYWLIFKAKDELQKLIFSYNSSFDFQIQEKILNHTFVLTQKYAKSQDGANVIVLVKISK